MDEPDTIFPIEGHPAIWPDTGFIDLVSTSRPPLHVSLLSQFLLSTSWFGVCRDNSAPSVTPVRHCRRMRPCEQRTVLPMRCARRRRTRRRQRRKHRSMQSCSAESASRDRMRKWWRMMTATMTTSMRRRRMTSLGMSWHTTSRGRPCNRRHQHRSSASLRPPRRCRWRMSARRRRIWIATHYWGLPRR